MLKEVVKFESVSLTPPLLADADCCVIVTGHHNIDYGWVVSQSNLVVDTVNATRDIVENREKIIRLGAPNQLGRYQ